MVRVDTFISPGVEEWALLVDLPQYLHKREPYFYTVNMYRKMISSRQLELEELMQLCHIAERKYEKMTIFGCVHALLIMEKHNDQ